MLEELVRADRGPEASVLRPGLVEQNRDVLEQTLVEFCNYFGASTKC